MKRAIAIALLGLSTTAIADINGWSGEGELGFSMTDGNTETETLNAKLGLGKEIGKWKHALGLAAVNSSTDGITSAERYLFTTKHDYSFTERTYGVGTLRYEDDRFSAYDYQAAVTAGIGQHVIKSDTTILDLEAGIGYRKSELNLTGESLNEVILRLFGHYTQKLTSNTEFLQDILIEPGEDNTYIMSVTGLKVSMSEKLALKVGYTIFHNTDVPAGIDDTDTLTSVNLVYGF